MSKKIVLLLAVAAAAAATLPNLYGLVKAPPGTLYLWSSLPWDSNTYLALMRLGYEGAWLQTNLLTSEPHPPVLSLPFYIVLGHAARVYGRAWEGLAGETIPAWRVIPLVYHHSRTLLTLALVFAIYGLASLLTTRRHRRLWIVTFAVFANGARWGGISAFTESSVLASCISFPHFIAALILYTASCAALIMALQDDAPGRGGPHRGRRAWALALGFVGGLGLGWIHPFDLPPLFAAGAVVLGLHWLQTRRPPRAALAAYCVFCAVSGLSVLYQMSIAWRLPDFRQIDSQNVLYWWSRWASLDALDGAFLLSLPGLAFLLRRRRGPEAVFLAAWIAAIVVAIHVPVKFQRRMIEGLPIALASALPWTAEAVVAGLLRWKRAAPLRTRARIRLVRHAVCGLLLLALLPRTAYFLHSRSIGSFSRPTDLYYVDFSELNAADWLAKNAKPGSVVWASKRRGNRLPFLCGMRVYYGHDVMTVRSKTKEEWTAGLFGLALPVSEFRRIVKQHRVDYVFWTLRDRIFAPNEASDFDIGSYDPETLGKPVFDDGFAKVFAVSRGP